jgi:hypothetical protein
MFKKFTALFLLTAFTQVYAVTPVMQSRSIAEELNQTFDQLNYKLNVEWDQKDAKTFDQTIAGFEKEIAGLQEKGLTSNDLVKQALDKIKDKEVQNDIRELSKVVDENQMTQEEARAFIISKLNSTYNHGASWSGSRCGSHTALIVGVIIVLLVCCHHSRNNDTTTTQPQDPCNLYPEQCIWTNDIAV